MRTNGVSCSMAVIALMSLGCLGCSVPAPGSRTSDVLRVQKLVLVDAQGNERGSLGVQKDGVGLVLNDAKGRRRLAIGSPTAADPEGTRWVIMFADEKGKDRLLLAVSDNGEGGGLALWDAQGITRGGLGEGPTGAGCTLSDEKGVVRASMGVGATGVGIGVRDDSGKNRVEMGVGGDWGGISVTNKDGRVVWTQASQ